jgi:hypothetical protein
MVVQYCIGPIGNVSLAKLCLSALTDPLLRNHGNVSDGNVSDISKNICMFWGLSATRAVLVSTCNADSSQGSVGYL